MAAKKRSTKVTKSVDEAIKVLEAEYGVGMLTTLADADIEIETVSTGSFGLDMALGSGGYPRGRVVEVFGRPGSGKSTLGLHAVAETQRAGGKCAYIDMEAALDRNYAIKLGVDPNALLYVRPDYGEQALNIVDGLVNSNDIDLIIVDSVSSLVPKAELEGKVGDSHMALQARMMGQGLRKITTTASKSRCVIYFINQIRDNPGAMFGPKTTTPGGRALPFYASVRLEVVKIATNKDKNDKVTGQRVQVKIQKNKVGPPGGKVEFDLTYDKGIHHVAELLDVAVDAGIVEKAGAHYTYQSTADEEGVKIGYGRDATIAALEDNAALMQTIEDDVRKLMVPDKVFERDDDVEEEPLDLEE